MQDTLNNVRLDKWLWAARFYKTRSLATQAIKGGKIHVNNQRCKPSRTVETGSEVRIKKDSIEQTVIILLLSDKRGPAKVAQTLYEETIASLEKRNQEQQQRRALYASFPQAPAKRPSKKDRRKIVQFKQTYD